MKKHSHNCTQCGGWYSCDQACIAHDGKEFSRCLSCVRDDMPDEEYMASLDAQMEAR